MGRLSTEVDVQENPFVIPQPIIDVENYANFSKIKETARRLFLTVLCQIYLLYVLCRFSPHTIAHALLSSTLSLKALMVLLIRCAH